MVNRYDMDIFLSGKGGQRCPNASLPLSYKLKTGGSSINKVLVVGNDLTIRQEICDNMQNEFTDICCITSVAEALDGYMKEDYCLVILNIQFTKSQIKRLRKKLHSKRVGSWI